MLSIKEYAEKKGVTYEAIRKQITRYKKELRGKIVVKNRTTFLTDDAVDFLNEHRAGNPVIVYAENKTSEIETLRGENKDLLIKIAEIQSERINESARLLSKIDELREKLEHSKDDIARIQSETIKKLEANSRKWWQFGKK